MGVPGDDLLGLIARLGDSRQRRGVLSLIAAQLGVDSVVLMVRDPDLGVLLPAPGLAQTLHGGRDWRTFLAGCDTPGRRTGRVDLPAGEHHPCLALVDRSVAAILLGGCPQEQGVALFERLLPLVGEAVDAQTRCALHSAREAQARDAAGTARQLAEALDQARAQGAELNRALRAEHRQKDDFLAMLSHELRNPLAPLASSIELVCRDPSLRDQPAILDSMAVMRRQVQQLSHLVDDLLDVSRVSRGRIELRRELLAIGDVVSEAVESNRPLFESARHEVSVSLPDDPLWVEADPVRLSQIFGNVVHNAIKYTDPGGRIEVSARACGAHVEVRVRDNGIGISTAMLPRVFDLFSQDKVNLDRSRGGLGIGLTLARSLVELHGGSIAAESAGSDQGSVFVVRLPSARAPVVRPVGVHTRCEHTRELSVLVVDDNEDAATTLSLLIEAMGHRAQVAFTGLEALKVAGDMDADLFLVDIGLPEMDGYETVRRLRRVAGRAARFVALTGYGSAEDKRRALAAGFDDHIVKPISPEALEAVLGGD